MIGGLHRVRVPSPAEEAMRDLVRAREDIRGADRRGVSIARREDLMIAARKALEEPDDAEHLRRTRPRIERLLGLAAHRYGARKSRYTDKRKATLQAAWSSAVVNLNPIAGSR